MSTFTKVTTVTVIVLSGVAAIGCGHSRRHHALHHHTTTKRSSPKPSSPAPTTPTAPAPPPPSSGGSSAPGPSSPSAPSVTDSDAGGWVMEAGLAPITPTEVVLLAFLAQVEPTTFAPPVGPTISASGTPSSGSLTVDFGSGSILNMLTLSGAVTGSWAQTGPTAWQVSLAFADFGTTSLLGGTSRLDGSLTLAVAITGTTVSATLSGSLTKVSTSLLSGTSTTTITPSITYAIDAATGLSVLDGSLAIATDGLGTWTAVADSLTFGSGAVQSGAFEMQRNSFPAVSVTFTFTQPNQGTYAVRPLGLPVTVTGPFSL